jgi:hypothetical protein
MCKSNKICSRCGSHKEDGHQLNALKEPVCGECFALGMHGWRYLDSTYDFYKNEGWANDQLNKQKRWRKEQGK